MDFPLRFVIIDILAQMLVGVNEQNTQECIDYRYLIWQDFRIFAVDKDMKPKESDQRFEAMTCTRKLSHKPKVILEAIFLTASIEFSQVLFLFKESTCKLDKLLLGTDGFAPWRKGLCHGKTLLDVFTGIALAGGTSSNPALFAARGHLIPTPVFRFTPHARYFRNGYHMVPISDSLPKLGGMKKLFLGLFIRHLHIPRTCGAVISACGYDFFHRPILQFILRFWFHLSEKPIFVRKGLTIQEES